MSRVGLRDSINPKPLSEGIGEYPRQLAPSVGNLSAQDRSSAAPVTSAAFLLESPTPAKSRDPIRCGSYEFMPRREELHPNSMASSHNTEAVFNGVHFVIDSGGFLRLPGAGVSDSKSITFSRADHPKAVPRPGHAALVLEAQIGGYNMGKVFMDGGSGLNLLFASTMRAMGLTVDMLKESDTGFHGIIPTRPAYSLGKTSLDVVFGTPSNFRKERVEFEVHRKAREKALPFYNLMKKSEKFEWTKEAQDSFDNLKKILSTSPVLVTPREKETLLMYIAATAQVFSSVLVVEREKAGRVHGVQRPVYYLSEVLTPARQRYPHHQKLAYAAWRSARKLRHYFTEHPLKL
ncbi:hypothetical protein QYE76_036514 [Lolium multiflorum]|uniref:Reverse transcriptase/retrotransposon-derived protein RNase H-like domain-containing protein n=1 Tax=Lolium multiflorum TaxID=4521 RepID=A0AAD8R1W6_LOLMU|nr:hypothetical protein QYE76_036514 [Lolium multiflorum]